MNIIWRRSKLAILVASLTGIGGIAILVFSSTRGSLDGDRVTEEGIGEAHAGEEAHAEGEGPVVVLDSAALGMANLRLVRAEAVRSNALPVTGTITYDGNRVSHVGPKIEGRIVELSADLGSRVRQGAPLAILESAEVGATRAERNEAQELVEIARENFEREQRLEAQGISSRKELLGARAELRRAESILESAGSRLRILGAERGAGGEFAVVAPFDGVVVEKHASRGEVVGPADQVFTVADLSRLWIELDIFERNLSQVEEGQPVRITTAAYPARTFPGRIVYVGDILDSQKRTVRARVELLNRDRALKPGMFASALIETPVGSGAEVVAVPRAAVQDIDRQTMVWVPGHRAGEFAAVPVEVGEDLGDGRVAIRSGLEPGGQVVAAGAFTLKAELSKGELGGGHAH